MFSYKYLDSNGYIMIKRPQGHPGNRRDGNILEHRFIMEKHLQRILKPNEIVHHLNGVKTDNRIENLSLASTNSEHLSLHKVILYSPCKCGCGEIVISERGKPVKYIAGHLKPKKFFHPETGLEINGKLWYQIRNRMRLGKYVPNRKQGRPKKELLLVNT